MPDDEEARRNRAEELRRQISEIVSHQDERSGEKDDSKLRPGESPKQYIERRRRELEHNREEV